MSFGRKPAGAGSSMSAVAIRAHLRYVVPRVLRQDSRPVKVLARLADVTERCIEGIRYEGRVPGAATLIALRRVLPELDAEIRRIETMRSDLDPDMDRAAMELYRTAQRLLAERAEKVKIREDANGGA